jgi:hypothetical protein
MDPISLSDVLKDIIALLHCQCISGYLHTHPNLIWKIHDHIELYEGEKINFEVSRCIIDTDVASERCL